MNDIYAEYDQRLRIIDLVHDTRRAGITSAFRNNDGSTELFSTVLLAVLVVVLGILATAGVEKFIGQELPGWVLVPAALIGLVAVFAHGTKRIIRADARLNGILDDPVALLREGLATTGGVGGLPATVSRVRHDYAELDFVVKEYVQSLNLTPSQQQLWNQLLDEGYVGSLAELAAAAVSLG